MQHWFLVAVVAASACIEDGTKDYEEYCWKDEHCVEDLVCYENACLTEEEADAAEALSGGGGGGGGGGGNSGILCNDGTRSPTCTTCTSGCCSGHGGCRD